MKRIAIATIVLCLLATVAALARSTQAQAAALGFRLPTILSDNMVLQQDTPVRIWGWAPACRQVTAKIAGQSLCAFTRVNANIDDAKTESTFLKIRNGGDVSWGDASYTFFQAQWQFWVTPAE